MHPADAFASSLIECRVGVTDLHPGREVQNYQEMQVADMEAAWVPIMVRCTPHGETPGRVWVAQPLTSAIRDPRGRRQMLRSRVSGGQNRHNKDSRSSPGIGREMGSAGANWARSGCGWECEYALVRDE